MSIKQHIIDWVTGWLKIPSAAMNMFKAANDISGINSSILPTELIPLNSIQLSRGLLNFTVIQSRLNWVLPFWAVKQYNPGSRSFIPRSHTGLSMNVTHRNWTGVGTPSFYDEPIVDPAGLVTPLKNGWSIDTWLKKNDEIFFPSQREVKQELVNNLPIVRTSFNFGNLFFTTTVFCSGNTLHINTCIENRNTDTNNFEIFYAVRPFNPEGVCLVNDIEYSYNKVIINKQHCVQFDKNPSRFMSCNFEEGDIAELLKKGIRRNDKSVHCKAGLATAAVIFEESLTGNATKELNLFISLDVSKETKAVSIDEHINYWQGLLSDSLHIVTPDKKLNDIFEASVATLLMLVDNEEIMPGPFTYHQFWFRDAAYMIYALDKLGLPQYSFPIINSFKKHQDKDGYFRSQKGEWDSNGQAIWTMYQHYLLTDNINILSENFDASFKAVNWIKNNLINKSFNGLLPAGLSAEHLGLVDYYYWDNFWSLAGISSFIKACTVLGKQIEKEFAVRLYNEYYSNTLSHIENTANKYSTNVITAGPARNVDCGMIGSVCAIYPLQLSLDKAIALNTLNYIKENYFIDGLFFQNFIHSGMNIYLSLQTAHSFLYLGKRNDFIDIIKRVIDAATPVLNFPEAIHPHTLGGVMGDGHHGWAAAEFILAVRDAFIYETESEAAVELTFFAGLPADWFCRNNEFYIDRAPAYAGNIYAGITVKDKLIKIIIQCDNMKDVIQRCKIILPVKCSLLNNSDQVTNILFRNNETTIEVKPGSLELMLIRCEEIPGTYS